MCEASITSAFDPQLGFIPALLDGADCSPIIPAPHWMGILPASNLTRILRTHLETILKPGICLFEDGGWKLSTHSVNSWMSKIFLAQYIAEKVLPIPANPHADW